MSKRIVNSASVRGTGSAGVPEDKQVTATVEEEKKAGRLGFKVASMEIFTTDGEIHSYDAEYRVGHSTPFEIADGIVQTGFKKPLDTKTVCYGPAAILKVIV